MRGEHGNRVKPHMSRHRKLANFVIANSPRWMWNKAGVSPSRLRSMKAHLGLSTVIMEVG